jgi:hypothetical protein
LRVQGYWTEWLKRVFLQNKNLLSNEMIIEGVKNIIKYLICGILYPQITGSGSHSDLS